MGEPALGVWGCDHHRTPVVVRERLAIAARDAGLLATLTALPGGGEALVLSTCNRCEIYLGGMVDPEHVAAVLAERCGVPTAELAAVAYHHRGGAAVRHLFRVAASLESLVVGEHQIVAQVKSAYDAAQTAGAVGPVLHPLLQRALAVSKEVRSSTAIGRHKLSIVSVAVDLARQIHGDLADARLLVVGAGEMAELAVKHLLAAGVRRISICNRTQENALALAELAGSPALPWSSLGTALAEHDIVVSSTSAAGIVISEEQVRLALRRRPAPLMLIDLAVPRDIDDRVARLDDVFLYNVDHLEQVVAANRGLRSDEVAAAAALIDMAAQDWCRGQAGDRAALLAQVAGWFGDVVAAEDLRLAGRLATTERAEVRYGLERVGNKLAHRLLAWLKEHPEDPAAERLVREVLGIDLGLGQDRVEDAERADKKNRPG